LDGALDGAGALGPVAARGVAADGIREAITVAAVQVRNRPDRPEERRAAIEMQVARAAEAGAELILLPELSHSGYVPNGTVWDLAETMDGPSVRHVRSLARRHRVYLGAGLVLREGDDVVNAYLLADDAGEVAVSEADLEVAAVRARGLSYRRSSKRKRCGAPMRTSAKCGCSGSSRRFRSCGTSTLGTVSATLARWESQASPTVRALQLVGLARQSAGTSSSRSSRTRSCGTRTAKAT